MAQVVSNIAVRCIDRGQVSHDALVRWIRRRACFRLCVALVDHCRGSRSPPSYPLSSSSPPWHSSTLSGRTPQESSVCLPLLFDLGGISIGRYRADLAVASAVGVSLAQSALYDVPGGHRAVIFDRFSGVKPNVSCIYPWALDVPGDMSNADNLGIG